MRIYYLDEPLNDSDLALLKEAISTRDGLRSLQKMEQVKVPCVLPVDSDLANMGTRKVLELIKGNLLNAGAGNDYGTQVAFVMPQTTHWGLKFQVAIMELTGIGPYTFQRWRVDEEGKLYRGNSRVVDTHGMFGEKG